MYMYMYAREHVHVLQLENDNAVAVHRDIIMEGSNKHADTCYFERTVNI